MRKQTKQGGFTLVEIAIVMVIIGLLLGGALKGQEMITNAKTKQIKRDFDQYVAAFYSYQDMYRSLPGDNDSATDHGGTDAAGGNAGNGVIDSDWNNTNDANETRLFWEHLRTANLIAGTGGAQPTNAFGGIVGVDNNAGSNDANNNGIQGLSFCFNNIDFDIAQIIDNQYDDGDGSNGTYRGYNNNNLNTAADYTANTVALCIEI